MYILVCMYITLTWSVGWSIQTNIAPISWQAFASSDTSGMGMYTSPYWLYKCFIRIASSILPLQWITQMSLTYYEYAPLKWVALALKFSVLIKTRIWTPFNVSISLNDFFYSETRKIKYFLDPPKKGAEIRTVAIWLHPHVFIYRSSLWPEFLLGRNKWLGAQRNPFIKNYFSIIVMYNPLYTPTFQYLWYFILKKTHEVSTQGPLT